MDPWVESVRDLKDSAPDAYEVETICRDILYYVRTKRIRDTGKFVQHLGPEYEAFIASLRTHNPQMVEQVVQDEAFWTATLAFVPKTNTLQRTV